MGGERYILNDFQKRLDKAKRRIKERENDKEINNIFFLILFEMSYIFSTGRAIAGFKENNWEPKSDEQEGLIKQPLNTLHLTERVIQTDHFDELLCYKINLTNGQTKSALISEAYKLQPGAYQISQKNKALYSKLFNSFGISEEEKRLFFSSKLAYLFICNFDQFRFYVFFIDSIDLSTCYTKLHTNLQNKFLSALVQSDEAGRMPRPYCEKVRKKEPLRKTLLPSSVDEDFYTREYLDKAIDSVNEELLNWVARKECFSNKGAVNGTEGIRAFFLRTMRLDVNYFLPIMTPSMRKTIFNRIKSDGKVFQYASKNLFTDFRTYSLSLRKTEVKKLNWGKQLLDDRLNHFLNVLIEEGISIDKTDIYKNFNESKKSVLAFMRNGEKSDLSYTFDRHNDQHILLLSFYACAFAESSPLVGGIAYTVGKKGCSYVCIGWHDDNHPFLINLKKKEKPIRYPKFMGAFFDKYILRQKEFPVTVNIPVELNGKLFGVFLIYPRIGNDDVSKRQFFLSTGNCLDDLRELIYKKLPDLTRSFFLDICNNITRKLAGGSEESKRENSGGQQSGSIFRQSEELLRKAHVVPRTFIAEITGKDDAGIVPIIRKKLKLRQKDQNAINSFLKEASSAKEGDQVIHFSEIKFPALIETTRAKQMLAENRCSLYNYLSCLMLNIEGRKFIILQVHEKPKNCLSEREKNNSSYLYQAIETGIVSLVRQRKINEESSKAALTAIMARNLSHNIGSHVLSYWNQEIERLGLDTSKRGILLDTDKDSLKETQLPETYIKQIGQMLNKWKNVTDGYSDALLKSQHLLQYIQHRMDFLAEMSTSIPCSEVSLDIKNDVIGPNFLCSPFYLPPNAEKLYTKKNHSVLLEFLAKSEHINLHHRVKLNIGPTLSGTRVSIPNGIVGMHAFYGLLENFIRNAAKHYHGKSNKKNIIIINVIESKDWSKDYVTIEVWDMREHSCDIDTVKKLRGFLPGGRHYVFAKDGQLEPGGWGIKEMLSCANFLRKKSPKFLLTKHNRDEPQMLEIICDDMKKCLCSNSVKSKSCSQKNKAYEYRLGIRFYLRKPKDLAIINKPRNIDIEKGIFDLEEIDEIKSKVDEIPHKMLLLFDETNTEKYEKSTKIPCRISFEKKTRNLPLNDDYYLQKYEKFIGDQIVGEGKVMPKLSYQGSGVGFFTDNECQKTKVPAFIKNYIRLDITSGKEWNWNNQINNLTDTALFYYHIDPNNLKKLVSKGIYVQPISGSYSTKLKLDTIQGLQNDNLKKQLVLELIEAAYTRVAIIDERVSEWSQGDIESIKRKKVLDNMRLFIVDVDLKNITYNDISTKVKALQQMHFIVMHQGILDKVAKESSQNVASLIKLLANKARWMIVDSGRGVPPNLMINVRFVEVSALLKLLMEYDKHGIVQTLFSSRNPQIKEE